MATVAIPAAPAGDQRVVLHNLGWQTYERLLSDLADDSAPRLTYDRGELEILSPGIEHERQNRSLEILLEDVALELGIEVTNVGSMTYKREDLARGFEPDSSFYIEHASVMREKPTIDSSVDPPPELVIEVEATRSAIAKLPIYAALGVPEVWRCDGDRVAIFRLIGGEYRAVPMSGSVPPLTPEVLSWLLAESRTRSRIAWRTMVRDWARGQRPTP